MDLIKKCKYALVCLSIVTPSIAFSGVVGLYDNTNRDDFDFNSQQNISTYTHMYPLIDAHDSRVGYFCHDDNLVPGKLVNGYCYVELNGNNYRNFAYSALKTPSYGDYRLLRLSNGGSSAEALDFIRYNGVTTGGRYETEGGYVLGEYFHCYILEGSTGRSAFGHYNLDTNKCSYELHGSRYIHPTVNMAGWEVSVLVAVTPSTYIPWNLHWGSALNNPYSPPVGGGGGGGGGHIQ